MEVARLFQWSLFGTKKGMHLHTKRGKKKTRGVELMLQKLKVFLLKREKVAHVVHIRRPEISGNTLEKFLYPDV